MIDHNKLGHLCDNCPNDDETVEIEIPIPETKKGLDLFL
jgi:hypothetical protein